MAIKITKLKYSGAGKVHDQGEEGLSSVIRKLAQDSARTKLSGSADITDSSGGTAAGGLEAQAGTTMLPHTESGTNSAPKAGFDTATGKIANAQATLAGSLNTIFTDLGLDLITDNTGGTDGAGTIALLDLALIAASTLLVDEVTGRAVLEVIKTNTARLAGACNRVAVATGNTKIDFSLLGAGFDGGIITLDAIGATGASVDGTGNSTLSDVDVDAELAAIANNVADMAAFLNAITGTAQGPLQVVAFDA